MLITVVFTTVQIDVKAIDPPVADANGPYYGKEGIPIDFNGSDSLPNDNTLEYRWKFNGVWSEWSENSTSQYTWFDDCLLPVTLEVRIKDTNITSLSWRGFISNTEIARSYI